uniref:Putative secreted protein n=1 Tax=Ixodes ricinus TaxID=34613 RepID=A0A6B0U6Z8_IXORI
MMAISSLTVPSTLLSTGCLGAQTDACFLAPLLADKRILLCALLGSTVGCTSSNSSGFASPALPLHGPECFTSPARTLG